MWKCWLWLLPPTELMEKVLALSHAGLLGAAGSLNRMSVPSGFHAACRGPGQATRASQRLWWLLSQVLAEPGWPPGDALPVSAF